MFKLIIFGILSLTTFLASTGSGSDLTLDASFRPYVTNTRDTIINTIAPATTGKYYVGGRFNSASGIRANGIARFNADGTVDDTFVAAAGGLVNAIAVQLDGKILVAGQVNAATNGTVRAGIIRLNSDGSVDQAFSNGNGPAGIVWAITLQSDGKLVIGGIFSTVNGVERAHIARLNPDASLDLSFNAGLSGGAFVHAVLAVQNDKIMVGGGAGQVSRLNVDGSVDSSFTYRSNLRVNAFKLQPNGKLLLGGSFNRFADPTAAAVVRLNPDSSVDATFSAQIIDNFNPETFAIDVGVDGKIMVAGRFGNTAGPTRSLYRLNVDGTIDESFQPFTDSLLMAAFVQDDGATIAGGTRPGEDTSRNLFYRFHADGNRDIGFPGSVGNLGSVNAVKKAPDGKLYIVGDFVEVNGQEQKRLARLNRDGSLDNSFSGTGANGRIYDIAVQADGKILIAGDFGVINGALRLRLARLNLDGTVDGTFQVGSGVDLGINDIALQDDGKILIGGIFSTYDGIVRKGIARINVDGSLDPIFNIGTPGPSNAVSEIVPLQNGKTLVAGYFSSINGVFVGGIARLNSDGTRDVSFNSAGTGAGGPAGPLYWIEGLALQADGKILVGGNFLTFNGIPRTGMARLNPNGSLDLPINIPQQTVLDIQIDEAGKLLISSIPPSADSIRRGRFSRIALDGTIDFAFDVGPYESFYSTSILSSDEILMVGDFKQISGRNHAGLARLGRAPQSVSVSGRVTTPQGLGLRNAVVSIIDANGAELTATTSSFGIYAFSNIQAAQTHTIRVRSKRYRFAPLVLRIDDDLSNVDLVGLE